MGDSPLSPPATYEILYEGLLRAVLGLWKVKIYPSAGIVSPKWKPSGIWENAWKVADQKFDYRSKLFWKMSDVGEIWLCNSFRVLWSAQSAGTVSRSWWRVAKDDSFQYKVLERSVTYLLPVLVILELRIPFFFLTSCEPDTCSPWRRFLTGTCTM